MSKRSESKAKRGVTNSRGTRRALKRLILKKAIRTLALKQPGATVAAFTEPGSMKRS